MVLYRFLNTKYALEAIKTQKLKVSTFNQLNDPFELLALSLEDKKVRAFMKKVKKALNENVRLISFSEKYSNNLLWSHYADKHRGAALEIEIDGKQKVEKIDYIKDRISVKLFSDFEQLQNTQDPLLYQKLSQLFFMKSIDWKYESEFRVTLKKEHIEKINNLEYLDLNRSSMRITRIILGAFNKTKDDMIKNSLPSGKKISVVRVRPAFRSFNITTDHSKPERVINARHQ